MGVIIEPRAFHGSYVELRSIGIRSSIGHAHPSGTVVLNNEVFVAKVLPVDTVTYKPIEGKKKEVNSDILELPTLSKVIRALASIASY